MAAWLRIPLLIICTMAIGAGATILYDKFVERPARPTLEDRISLLTKSLADASSAISAVEKEIQARQVLVENLKKDAEVAKQLATLSKEQSEAVAQALELQLKKQESGGFWWTFALSTFFTLLGVVLSEASARWRKGAAVNASRIAQQSDEWPRYERTRWPGPLPK